MSCPAWEDCNKKSCMENEQCVNKEYWNSASGLIHRQTIRKDKESDKKDTVDGHNPCPKGESKFCNKRTTCEFLGQCIFTISAVKGNKALIKALSGKKSMKQVIEVFAKHNPKPMISYYPNLKNKK